MISPTPRADRAPLGSPAWALPRSLALTLALLPSWVPVARAQEPAPAPPSEAEVSEGELDALIEGGDEERRQRALWLDFKRSAALYIESAKEQKEASAAVFKRLYQAQVDRVEVRYARPIKSATEEERKQRRESIERFKSFLESHPPHPQYTPDSLYRLAMLLLEEEDADFLDRMEVYRERLKTASADEDLPPPQRDHRKVISTFTRLIEEWPEYRDLDGAFYARAHSFLEMGEEQTAMRDFREIIRRFPTSEYKTEVWNLIGELHFRFAELKEAIAAYSEVLKDKESQYYAAAFYKLAWTYYRNDQFEEAVEAFKALITYSDELVAQGKRPFELRGEAIQYLAISLNEDDWDDDGVTDSGAGFARVQRYVSPELAYQGELLEAMVDIFFETSKYDDAIRTAQLLFKAQPFYRSNPLIHAKVVTAYERIAQPDLAFKSRDQLNSAYITDGPWYAANYKDQSAIDAARGLMKDSLLQAGTYHHERAQALRARALEADNELDRDALMREAKESYRTAAASYQGYLARYKNDENTYELMYLVADALYYSEDYPNALAQYVKVRDSRLSDEHKEDSAFSAILCHMEVMKAAIKAGQLAPKPSLLDEQRAAVEGSVEAPTTGEGAQGDQASGAQAEGAQGPRKVTPEELPPLAQEALALREAYLGANLSNDEDAERVPVMVYKVGEIHLDYKDYPKARERFERIISEFPKSSVAVAAANALIETYREEQDWAKLAEWAERIGQAGLGAELEGQAKVWKVGALFKTAQALFNSKRYEEAAKEYISLVDQNPDNEFAAAALNNGAVAFERARMFDSAMRTFERIFNQFPNSDFSENALFRVAYNAERFYDYDKAVVTFSELARRYPTGEHAANAAFNAARLLEQTQQYSAAARAYEQFVQRFPEREDAPEIFFGAATCFERLKDTKSQLRIYDTFRKRFGGNPKAHKLVVRALAESIDIYKRLNNDRQVKLLQQQLIKEFDERGLAPGSYEARFPAQAAFELIEGRFNAFTRLKIAGTLKQQGRVIKLMKEEIVGLTEDYSKLLRYKALDWTIAAFYRIGLLRQLFAASLYAVPMPSNLTPEEEDIYTTQIEEIAIPIEDEAVQRFEAAYEKAREFRIANEWTRKILLSLNKYKPAQYPTFKDEKRLEVRDLFTTSQLLLPKESRAMMAPPEEAPAEGAPAEGAPAGGAPADGAPAGGTPGAGATQGAPTAPETGARAPKVPTAPAAPTTPDPPPAAPAEVDVEEVEL